MEDYNKVINQAKEYKEYFWNTENNKFYTKRFKDFVVRNEKKWIENAHSLRKSYPVETNILMANLFCSRSSFKLLTDKLKFVDLKKRFSTTEKLRILKDAFENSYHYFVLLTICANYSNDYVAKLSKVWNDPNKAREYIKKKEQGPWLNSNGDIISGKKWILLNCPIFRFSPIDIKFLQQIKNADSHEKLVITDKEIIILSNEENIHLSKYSFNQFFRFILDTLNYSLTFLYTLSIKHNFWIVPCLILVNPDSFNYKRLSLPDITTITETKRKGLRKKENNFPFSFSESQMVYGFIIYEFVYYGIWEGIRDEKNYIDNFFKIFNLHFNYDGLIKHRKKAIYETVRFFINMNDKFKKTYLGYNIKAPTFTVKEDMIDEFDKGALINDFFNTLQLIQDKKVENQIWLLLQILISIIIGLGTPLNQLMEGFKVATTTAANKRS